jgi:Fe-S cluster assembly protein SufD
MNVLNGSEKINSVLPGSSRWSKTRELALQKLTAQGLPTRKNEEWKYTNVKALSEGDFLSSLVTGAKASHETENEIQKFLSAQFFNLVFINGFLSAKLSNIDRLEIVDLSQVMKGDKKTETTIDEIEAAMAGERDSFYFLSETFVGQGAVVKVSGALTKPLQVIFYNEKALAVHPRLYFLVDEGAQLQLVERYLGPTEAKYFINTQTDILLKQNAKMEYLRCQNDSHQAIHVGRTQVSLSANSNFQSLVYTVGGLLSRHNLEVFHQGESSTSVLNGIYLVESSQHSDNHTLIDHMVGGCTSQQLYKGILKDESRAVFNGKVKIRHGAVKASSEQLNKNLILNSKAEIDTKPELDIQADDVKATHGATVGQLNEEELFYFASRGISRKQAVRLLSTGFVADLVDRLENQQTRVWLNQQLQEKLQGWNL